MIIDSLRYWVEQMHVIGFCFDLAAILGAMTQANWFRIRRCFGISSRTPALAGANLIAEAWDATRLFQVGSFLADNWKKSNGPFRDDVRSFLRADYGLDGSFADRLLGAPALRP